MDTETVLTIVIALLSINLLFVGFYIVLVLKEVRESIRKVNEMLDTANQVTRAVAAPVMNASSTIDGFIEGIKALQIVKSRQRRKPDLEDAIPTPPTRGRRFSNTTKGGWADG